jgi:hypothetical protein
MKLQCALTLLLPLTLTTACLDSGDPLDETLAETESDLSTTDWSPTAGIGISQYPAQVATVNGTMYMVITGATDKNMYLRKRVDRFSWGPLLPIPGQKTSAQANLAAYNGYLYMVHVGETDTQAVWFSRFDPASETWTPNEKLAMSTDIGAPALAAFDGKLWIVGATSDDVGNNLLWVSTMDTSGEITRPAYLARKFTSSAVSLAVYANKLYMAFGSGNSIMTMTHGVGGLRNAWSAASYVRAAPSNTPSQGFDTRLAVAGGYLHLVHRRPGSYNTTTWWTYWNQCKWAPEVQFDQVSSDHPLALTEGGAGLMLVRGSSAWFDGIGSTNRLLGTEYSAPPPPTALPQCLQIVGT